MKIDRFEVGKSYKTYNAYGAIATVIARTEKTVTFRVVYTDYKGVHEEIVKKRIFMSGCEETSLIEFTKEGGIDFCNAHVEETKMKRFAFSKKNPWTGLLQSLTGLVAECERRANEYMAENFNTTASTAFKVNRLVKRIDELGDELTEYRTGYTPTEERLIIEAELMRLLGQLTESDIKELSEKSKAIYDMYCERGQSDLSEDFCYASIEIFDQLRREEEDDEEDEE